MNYYELLRQWNGQQAEKVLLVEDQREYSYGQMLVQVDALRAELAAKATEGMGGSILVLADTLNAQLVAFLALQSLHLRPILLHHGLPAEEIQAILCENRLQGLLDVRQRYFDQSNIDQSDFDWSWQESDAQGQKIEPEDILGVLSSGSTGVPKVMYRTYESWAGFFPVQNKIFQITRTTRLFLQGSLSFTGNLNALLGVLYAGGSIITSSRWHCRWWAQLMADWQVDAIYLVPAKLQLLAAKIKQPLVQVRSLFTGSQLLSERNIDDLQRLLPEAKIILYYGASELNYITYTVCGKSKRDSRNLGRPFPGIGLQVSDGIIYVDTPYHVSGLKPPFTVKDTGWLNEAGELMFEGRRENWINKGGVKLSTLRLENKLRAVPGIRAAVVMPMADKLRGSTVAAFVVKDESVSAAKVRREVRQVLQPVEIPRRLLFLPQLPLNDRGKVDRSVLNGLVEK